MPAKANELNVKGRETTGEGEKRRGGRTSSEKGFRKKGTSSIRGKS